VTSEVATRGDDAAAPAGADEVVDDRARALDEDDGIEPWWLVAGVLAGIAGLAVAGIVGLFLAIAGEFDVLLVIAIGGPIWVGLLALAWPLVRSVRARPAGKHAVAATVAVLVFLVAWVAWNAPRTSQHVLIERDPGSYTNTARWIARDGSLEVDVSGRPFAGKGDVYFGSAAIYAMPNQKLQFQFAHFAPVVFAEAQQIGGDRLMFRADLLISALAMLALFALGLRIVRQPWLALLAVVGLAVCLPQVWFSRDTYSELCLQALILGGLWLLALSRRSTRLGPAFVAGVVIGAMASTRIDAPLLLVAPIVVIGVEWLGVPRGDRRVAKFAAAFVAGGVIPVYAGWLDLTTRAGYYDSDLGPKYKAVWAAAGVALVGTTIVVALQHRVPRLRSWLAARRDGLGTAAAVAIGAGFVFLWGPRRLLSEPHKRKGNDTMRAIELREGIRPATGTKTYAEQTVEWLRWHMGIVALVLGILGAAVLACELVRRHRRDALGLFVAFATGGLLYLVRPSIFPDQPWAMRRFLPVLLPAMYVFAALAIGWIAAWVARRSRPAALAVGGALAVAMVVVTAAQLWPVRDAHAQGGYLKPVLWTCEEVGDDAAILVVPSTTELVHRTLPQALRSWCGVPVAVVSGRDTPERIQEIARDARADDRDLYLVAGEAEPLEALGAKRIRPSPTAFNDDGLISSLSHATRWDNARSRSRSARHDAR
jgi:hypothetical protein